MKNVLLVFLTTIMTSSLALADSNDHTINSIMISLEAKAERRLTQAELKGLEEFATLPVTAYTQLASVSDEPTEIKQILFCIGGKGAYWIRVAGAVCSDRLGNVYTLGLLGGGFAVGLAFNGFFVVQKGPLGSLKDIYKGASADLSAGLGVELGYFKGTKSNTLVIGGLSYGAMAGLAASVIMID